MHASRSPSRPSRRAVLTLAAALVAGLWTMTASVPATAEGAAAAGAGPVTILTFNMCGEHCNTDSTTGDVAQLMATIDEHRPTAVLLQEVCHDQFAALQMRSEQPGHWSMYGATDVTEPHGCDNGHDSFGDAVFVHLPFDRGTVQELTLPYVYGHGHNRQSRKVLCLLSAGAFPRATEVCTLHAGLGFEIGAKDQAVQIKRAYRFARQRDRHNPLVFGGDFNVTPAANALDGIYFKGGGGAHGAMAEVDECPGKHGRTHHSRTCNADTHDATPDVHHRTKNDYIFGSRKSFRGLDGSLEVTSFSDHRPLLGTMTECATGDC